MAPDVLTVYRILTPSGATKDVQASVPVKIRQQAVGEQLPVWRQIDEILMDTLAPAGSHSPDVAVIEASTMPVIVAPGVIVWPKEYKERYGGVDLEHFQRRMSPELFAAFVRYMGLIPGHPDLDVSQIATIPE